MGVFIKVKQIYKKNNRIEFEFDTDVDYLNLNEKFYYEFPFNVEKIPNSIAVIPFLGVVIPHSYVTNTTIYVDELDKAYYDSLIEIKKGYQSIYQDKMEMKGEIIVNKLIDNSYSPKEEKNILLYSGGVDSMYTYFKNKDDINKLLFIKGADFDINRLNEINKVEAKARKFAAHEKIDLEIVTTNFRHLSNYSLLSSRMKYLVDGYFGDLFHAHAYLAIAGVIAYYYQSQLIFISTTWGPTFRVIFASNPITDNLFRFASSKVIHYGEDVERRDRTLYLTNYPISYECLHVCFYNGKNCSICDKCLTTIATLDSANKLELYKEVFDIEKYKQNIVNALFLELSTNYPALAKYKGFYLYVDILKNKYPKEYKKAKRMYRYKVMTHSKILRPLRILLMKILKLKE